MSCLPLSYLEGNEGNQAHMAILAGKQGQLQPAASAGNRAVAVWLWIVAALVFLMVIVGGATRLTESGLSITEWKPVTGVIPPLSQAEWLAAFENYKRIPQYTEVFPN